MGCGPGAGAVWLDKPGEACKLESRRRSPHCLTLAQAKCNASVVKGAEAYYRQMFFGDGEPSHHSLVPSWAHRQQPKSMAMHLSLRMRAMLC